MLNTLGAVGVLGIVLLAAGIGLVAYVEPIIAAGIALVLIGLGLTVKAVVDSVLEAMGMKGAF